MPAPAVYVIAVVGTVGAAIIFKEFVYPHLAPRIDRWKAEFQAARQRRAESERSAVMAEVALIQRGRGKYQHQDLEDDSDSDQSDAGVGKVPVQPCMKNGLLIRRRIKHSETIPGQPGDVELDDWITGTSSATNKGSQQSDLRLRKNNVSLNEPIQPIQHTPISPIASPSRTPTNIRTGGEISNQTNTNKPVKFEPNKATKTIETHTFLDESIQAIPYTPLSPVRTPTPTHVLYNSSSMHSPSDSPFPTQASLDLPEDALVSKLRTIAASSSSSHPLLASFQPLSASPCAADTTSSSASKAELSPSSPPDLITTLSQPSSMAVASIAPVDAISSWSPLVLPSSPPAVALSSPSSQPTGSQHSPYLTPHVHAIPSLSQSYPLDDLLDYEHGLELLSPPSPLSRTDSPFELAGLSPKPERGERSTRDQGSGAQISGVHVDSITNSTSTAYLSFSASPTLSTSSVFASSENGYENDSSRSEISSTFSSPFVAPARLGLGLDIGSESSPPHDQLRRGHSMSPTSSASFDVHYSQRHRRHQQERNTGSSARSSVLVSPIQEFDARHPRASFNDTEYDDNADAQTLSPRNRTRSPWTIMNRRATESAATTLISPEIHSVEPAARLSRVIMSDSDFDTGSELSDLDLLNISAEEYEPSASVSANRSGGSVGPGSRSGMYTGTYGGSGIVERPGGIGKPRRGDGNESDTSSWSFASGLE